MYFFIKTQNPRPTFHLDMTDEERAIMNRHVAYWSEKATEGVALVFGPVMDPANGLLRYEVAPMARAVVGTLRATFDPT